MQAFRPKKHNAESQNMKVGGSSFYISTDESIEKNGQVNILTQAKDKITSLSDKWINHWCKL